MEKPKLEYMGSLGLHLVWLQLQVSMEKMILEGLYAPTFIST